MKKVRDSIQGAELPGFDESKWMPVDLTHNYSIMPLANNSIMNGNRILITFMKSRFI